MCDHSPNREAAMVVVRPGVWCDPCLVPLVTALNDAGLSTEWSCCGHGHRPGVVGLRDGRQLMVFGDLDEMKRLDHFWPDINGDVVGSANPPVCTDYQSCAHQQCREVREMAAAASSAATKEGP